MEGLIETKMDNQDLENNAEYWDWVSEDRRVAAHTSGRIPRRRLSVSDLIEEVDSVRRDTINTGHQDQDLCFYILTR